jgi:hypothetical protein
MVLLLSNYRFPIVASPLGETVLYGCGLHFGATVIGFVLV